MTPDEGKALQKGRVMQIASMPPTHQGWVGAFLLVTEVKSWGVQGFVHLIESHGEAKFAYTRLEWDRIDYIGEATMIPQE